MSLQKPLRTRRGGGRVVRGGDACVALTGSPLLFPGYQLPPHPHVTYQVPPHSHVMYLHRSHPHALPPLSLSPLQAQSSPPPLHSSPHPSQPSQPSLPSLPSPYHPHPSAFAESHR